MHQPIVATLIVVVLFVIILNSVSSTSMSEVSSATIGTSGEVAPVPNEVSHPRWEGMWKNGLKPGQAFDIIVSSPILIKYLQDGLIPPGRALVPGCGRGYDVTLLASADRSVMGLDISETAIKTAKERAAALHTGTYCNTVVVEKEDGQKVEQIVVEGVNISEDPRFQSSLYRPQTTFDFPNQVHFSTDNFFDLSSSSDNEKFDFIYDYTFLCALDPSIRPLWANKMAELVKPSGELLTIIYPIDDKKEGGPPFRVNLDLYKELLESVGFECLELRMLPSELCHPGRDGGADGTGYKSGVGRWRRK